MATTGRSAGTENASDASGLAATLSRASFVRVVARADGDALAASGLLVRALARRSIPFQARVVDPPSIARSDGIEDGTTLVVGSTTDDGPAIRADASPASVVAFDVARALGDRPDPVLALAGVVAAGEPPDASAHIRDAAAIERRPGVGVPTADLAVGLAHTTLAHASFSGDETAAAAALADLPDDGESVASLLTLATLDVPGASARAADAIERAIRPHAIPEGPFETVEGYADVIDCVAREAPGTALALTMGHDVRAEAVDAWRAHASSAHEALRSATTGRYDGLFVARIDDGPVETTARLVGSFRSPEPIALVVSDDGAGAAGGDGRDLDSAVRAAARAVDGIGSATAAGAVARFDGEPREFIAAFREAL